MQQGGGVGDRVLLSLATKELEMAGGRWNSAQDMAKEGPAQFHAGV